MVVKQKDKTTKMKGKGGKEEEDDDDDDLLHSGDP